MALQDLTEQQLETRLSVIEAAMSTSDIKELAFLNSMHQKIMDELVRRDLQKLVLENPIGNTPNRNRE